MTVVISVKLGNLEALVTLPPKAPLDTQEPVGIHTMLVSIPSVGDENQPTKSTVKQSFLMVPFAFRNDAGSSPEFSDTSRRVRTTQWKSCKPYSLINVKGN